MAILMMLGNPADEKKSDESHDMLGMAMMHHKEMIAKAKSVGKLKKDGSIDPDWLKQMSMKDDVHGKRARLSITLLKMKEMKKEEDKK